MIILLLHIIGASAVNHTGTETDTESGGLAFSQLLSVRSSLFLCQYSGLEGRIDGLRIRGGRSTIGRWGHHHKKFVPGVSFDSRGIHPLYRITVFIMT